MRAPLSDFTSSHWLLLAMGSAVYAMLMVYRINFAYLDFGDGNYLYISQRLAQGLTLYKDIVSPQPPLHVYLGSLLMSVADSIESQLTLVRTFSVLLHLLSMVLVVAVTYTIWGVARTATLAGLIYLVLPIGLWWGQGYQSEPLLQVLMLATFLALLHGGKAGLALGAVAAALACMTNMAFLPYLGLHILYVVGRYRNQRLWLWFIGPLVLLSALAFTYWNAVSGGAYIENVWSNQVGSFPKEGTVPYILRKWTYQGHELLKQEGAFILLALLGMFSQWRQRSAQAGISIDYAVWYGLASLGSLVFVAKGGTMQYIFTLGEPMVAVFAAFYLYRIHEQYLSIPLRQLGPVAGAGRVCAVVILILMLGLPTYIMTLQMSRDELPERIYERSHEEVIAIVRDIERHSPPGGLILAPPFYCFVSGRPMAGECPETYLIGIRYLNERRRIGGLLGYQPPASLREMQRLAVERGLISESMLDHGIVNLVERIVAPLRNREVHYVLLNVEPRQAFAMIAELYPPLAANYEPVGERNYGREEQLQAYRLKRATP